MMPPELRLDVLPDIQQKLFARLQEQTQFLQELGFYLAGGTGLALQIGHRRSVDFDYFSQQPATTQRILDWLPCFQKFLIREMDPLTLHAEVDGVKMSFIGNYRYPLVAEPIFLQKLPGAGVMDIGLMKLLAITHRAALRDYLDLAVILRDRIPLSSLLEMSRQKYGPHFNIMICLKALTSFGDVEEAEMPILLDKQLGASWREILTQAVKKAV